MTFCDLIIYNDNPLLIRLCTELDLLPNLSGFHRTFATGVACRQGTLTPPDTWSHPFGTFICYICWDQSFSELVVIFLRTLLFEYPWVLSRFCFLYPIQLFLKKTDSFERWNYFCSKTTFWTQKCKITIIICSYNVFSIIVWDFIKIDTKLHKLQLFSSIYPNEK